MATRPRGLLPLLAGALAVQADPALAQAWQCRVPPRITMPQAPRADAPSRSPPIARYTLALSWSPEFCHMRRNNPAHALQCDGGIGRFGFIVHGLWPEGFGTDPPQWCPARTMPSEQDIRANLCATPSPDLAAHEWAKHGSCMAKKPAGYFRAARALFTSLTLPDMARLSRARGLNAGAVRQAFVASTPFLRPEMIRLKLSESGWLQEVHICYSRGFMPARCPRRVRGPDDATPVKIWRSF